MTRKLLVSAALGLCLAAAPARASSDMNDPIDVEGLAMQCKGSSEELIRCNHYLMGVWDTLQSLQQLERAKARLTGGAPHQTAVCINHTPDIDDETLIRVFTRWANQHHESFEYTAAQGAMQAFMAAFPCT